MEFGILGPLYVRNTLSDSTPSAPMPRKVIALLVLEANTMVSTETIIRELWHGDQPRSAMGTLQTYVCQLRKAIRSAPDSMRDRLITTPLGYMLRVERGEVDLHQFEQRVVEARSAILRGDDREAAGPLREGLALWRGAPLCDIRSGPVLGIHALRLSERQLTMTQLRIEVDLRLGRHLELISELCALTSEHPHHEALHALLMVTFYRSNRRSEALATYGRLRRILIDDLGLEPSLEVQRLHAKILNEDSDDLVSALRQGAFLPQPTTWKIDADRRLPTGARI